MHQRDHFGEAGLAREAQLAAEMMRTDAGLHPYQARRHIGQARFHLATRPFLTQYDRSTLIVAYDGNEFLPISIPTTAIAALSVWDMACCLFWAPPPSV